MMRKCTSVGTLAGVLTAGLFIVMSMSSSRLHAGEPRAQATPAPSPRAVFDKYCVTCHSEKRQVVAGFMLDRMNVENVAADAEAWEKVVNKLRTAAMPPVGMPRPDAATYAATASWLEAQLDRSAAASPNPGRKVIHRLNRTEYTNAIRDLLALEIDGRALFAADDSGYGFDNIADVLSVSPGLLERYMSAARRISRLAMGDPTIAPDFDKYDVSPNLLQGDRMSENLPFGSRGGVAVRHYFPVDAEYVIKINPGSNGFGRGSNQLEVRLDGQQVKVFPLGAPAGSPRGEYQTPGQLQLRFPVKAGAHLVGVSFLENRTWAPEGLDPARLPPSFGSAFGSDRNAESVVGSVQIEGPFEITGPGDTASRRRILVCHDETEACAQRILSTLARRAYRRPVTSAEVQVLLGFYREGRDSRGFEGGIQRALERLLISPNFLFRMEHGSGAQPHGQVHRLTDLELASRLSFFLWSSIPDDELLDAAIGGKLRDPKVLDRHVRRMLDDDRAKALMSNFAGQWLLVRNVRTAAPDAKAFPEFDDSLREAFERETELFLESQLRDDRPVLELLTANYSYINERLAQHYQIPHVYGSHFRRVTFADGRRGGLLSQGSILTVTSLPTRTSPVFRGKWVLENLLGAPPPPPPPNVPALEATNTARPTSMRQRMELHRKNPVCASCHARMDPIGFALENYDALGGWRVSESGASIDASGTLPDGTSFTGPGGLRQFLVERREEIVKTVTRKLLTYALGRGVEYYDLPAVREIVRDAAATDYRWSDLILGIVKSTPFQMAMSQDAGMTKQRTSRAAKPE
jgi:mono/diheme cytochrome c family protein